MNPSGSPRADPATAVGIWLFDEPNVAVVKDLSGNGNDGLVRVPPRWIDGPFGKAVEFTGSGQMIEVPDSESLNFGDKQSFAVVVWFKFSQPVGVGQLRLGASDARVEDTLESRRQRGQPRENHL